MEAVVAVLMATVIGLLGAQQVIRYIHMGAQSVQNAVAASQLVIFDNASTKYLKDFGSTVLLTTNASAAQTVTAAMLTAANELPTGFAATNPFQQTLQLQILQPTPGVLEALVISTGPAIADPKQLVAVAAQAGAQGGFVPFANQFGNASMQPTNANGTYGAWQVPLARFVNPGAGHLASLLAFNGTQGNSDYLYRVAQPTEPALNNMQTDLGLTDTGGAAHNITGVNTVTATAFSANGGGEFDTDQGGSLELGGNNTTAGTGAPYIDFHHTGQGVQDFNVRVQNDAANHMTISAASGNAGVQVNGTLQLANIASIGAGCSPNGIVAASADGSGQMYSCLRGAWTPIGGTWVRMASNTVSTGESVAAPVCSAGGVPKIELAAQTFEVDPTATVNVTSSGAGPWTVDITDGSGAAIGGQALAETYCEY